MVQIGWPIPCHISIGRPPLTPFTTPHRSPFNSHNPRVEAALPMLMSRIISLGLTAQYDPAHARGVEVVFGVRIERRANRVYGYHTAGASMSDCTIATHQITPSTAWCFLGGGSRMNFMIDEKRGLGPPIQICGWGKGVLPLLFPTPNLLGWRFWKKNHQEG